MQCEVHRFFSEFMSYETLLREEVEEVFGRSCDDVTVR